MSRKFIILLFIMFQKFASAQTITGHVKEIIGSKEVAIPGVTIATLNNQNSTFTDNTGYFNLSVDSLPSQLVVFSSGYIQDTIQVSSVKPMTIILRKSIDLKEVDVSARKEAIGISTINPLNSEKITQRELLKAACCNLSEAFETNPSVNVAYKDAVTGIKEIQLLGLGGTYVQMLSENIPDMRGLAGIYGLTYIPGPWIESIQLSKGSGSVLNGYESTTGQINVEYKKPDDKDQPRFYLNLFGDERGAAEANAILKHKLNPYWSTILMLHGRTMQSEMDRNGDGFMDAPNNNTINIYNRWQYHSANKLESQIGFKFLTDENVGGQTDEVMTSTLYRTRVYTKRFEVFGKLGFIYPEKPSKSIGNIVQFTYHDMDSRFGLKKYDATESSFYVQSIYQNILWKSNHRYKAGFTFRYNLLEQEFPGLPNRIEEYIPGVFVEYTYDYLDKLTLIIGAREDLQENSKLIFTPRFHGKYNFTDDFIFRFSAGRSYRNPYIIADHISMLASSRQLDFRESILPEEAWNYGINFTKRFKISDHEITFSTDAYRTNFINQLVVDTYTDTIQIHYYNLDGKSYSNSLQFTFNIEVMELMNLRLAYKLDDVRSTFNGKLDVQPLIARDRLLGSLSYSTPDEHWKFDYTFVWEGKKKLQNVYLDDGKANKTFSPSYNIMNIQVTKVFRKFEMYGGAENLLDFRQLDPIINPENPFGNSFDATNIWGPIMGRRIYLGLRYSIK